ncbi:T9SS type A sorting domain-containing protein [Adhaeribacter terreus]|uniref:T9SS type A sorting domain-containing protein n=1 Tax=Adhaeribacter terreus TaxID=529703 RepID=A0ABW0EEC0_9BACT
MKRSEVTLFLKSIAILICTVVLKFPVSAQNATGKLDDFNRANSLVLGIPSSGGNTLWQETETAGSNDYRARIENNMLILGSFNNAAVGASGLEQVSFDASNRYATIFNQASAELTWAFNFRQNRSGTSGFGATTYGIAYVLGSSKTNFNDPDASGYAIIIGNANSPDPVKLVRFKNGLTANSNITTLISSTETTETAYYSVKVSFEPCSKTWTLQVRNDNGTFADPLTTSTAALTFSDQTYTNIPLNFTGAAYNHGTVNVTAYFDNLYLPAATALSALNYNWNGANSTDFSNPANWTPARNCVRAIDILNFNTGGNIMLSNITTQEIGQLLVTNNTNLTLKAATGATQTISLAGGTGTDFLVEAGSNLIIDSNDPLEISLKTNATASVSGTMVFQNTAINLGRAHRLLAVDANAVMFENGSQFIAKNLTGEPFGNSGTANIVTFKTNATYFSKDGASPFGLASPNSKVVFETGSLYKHEQTGTIPKLDGRIYGDFELNAVGNVAINFGTSATITTRIDNFTISSGNMNITLASGNTPLPLQIRGNFNVASGAAFNYIPAAAANNSLLTFNGSTRQQISGNINLGTFANLEINNPAGITLKTPLTINGNLFFSKGNINIDTAASLTFSNNATTSGASNVSYVTGKVFKTGDDAFIFPVGKNGFYAPVAISAPLNVTDQYVAEYFQANPKNQFGTSTGDSLVQISDSEYWDLERVSGISEVKVTLSYDAARSAYVANPQDLRIAHFRNSTVWENEGLANVGTAPPLALYSTRTTQASFSPFTFGAISANNPLPVELVHFFVETQENGIVLSWETASEINNSHFEIERSSNGKDFTKIGEVAGQGTSNAAKRYQFTDKNSSTTQQYYRLKQVDFDGKFTYSKIVSAKIAGQLNAIEIYPNPAQNILNVVLPKTEDIAYIRIFNLMGQELMQTKVLPGQTEQQLQIGHLPAGTYLLKTSNAQPALKFIKTN